MDRADPDDPGFGRNAEGIAQPVGVHMAIADAHFRAVDPADNLVGREGVVDEAKRRMPLLAWPDEANGIEASQPFREDFFGRRLEPLDFLVGPDMVARSWPPEPSQAI